MFIQSDIGINIIPFIEYQNALLVGGIISISLESCFQLMVKQLRIQINNVQKWNGGRAET